MKSAESVHRQVLEGTGYAPGVVAERGPSGSGTSNPVGGPRTLSGLNSEPSPAHSLHRSPASPRRCNTGTSVQSRESLRTTHALASLSRPGCHFPGNSTHYPSAMSSVKATKKGAFSCEPCRRRKVCRWPRRAATRWTRGSSNGDSTAPFTSHCRTGQVRRGAASLPPLCRSQRRLRIQAVSKNALAGLLSELVPVIGVRLGHLPRQP